jgi:hypothetical protein
MRGQKGHVLAFGPNDSDHRAAEVIVHSSKHRLAASVDRVVMSPPASEHTTG